MRFLFDEDVYAVTVRFLRSLGHDVVTATAAGGPVSSDEELLTIAHQQARFWLPVTGTLAHWCSSGVWLPE